MFYSHQKLQKVWIQFFLRANRH